MKYFLNIKNNFRQYPSGNSANNISNSINCKAWLCGILIVLTAFSHAPNSKPHVFIFAAAKCPCIYSHQETFGKLLNTYKDKIDFTIVFVDRNDDKEEITDMLENLGWKINYIIDKKGNYIKKYHPKVFSDCVFVSPPGVILYKGAVDDSPLNMGRVVNFYLKDAIEDYLSNKPVKIKEGKGLGCLITM